ncbi:MAG: DNA repair protein RadC [Clostridiaceae bacterium]
MPNVKLKGLPLNERPRERILCYGSEALSNRELLAIILRSGSKEEDILSLCGRLLQDFGGLKGLVSSSITELYEFKGIGEAKATQILAIGELIKRFNSCKIEDSIKISSPLDCANLMMNEMMLLNKEVLKIIMLNVKNIVLKVAQISVGSLNSSIVHPREVFYDAIKEKASSIIVCHNHPSGDPTPSKEDINITKRLVECGKVIGIEVIDHIIIGNNTYLSLKEKNIL